MKTFVERQEIFCHNCSTYVQFDIDKSLDGRHVLNCPKCGHEHCRYVTDGTITDRRWDSRNYINIMVSSATMSTATTSYYSVAQAMGTTASVMTACWTSSAGTSIVGTGF